MSSNTVLPGPQQLNISLYQGDTWPTIIYANPDGSFVNLIGDSWKLQAKDSTGNLVLTLQSSDGSITLGGAAGTIGSNTNTLALAAGSYSYDLFRTPANAHAYCVVFGTLLVAQKVTAIP